MSPRTATVRRPSGVARAVVVTLLTLAALPLGATAADADPAVPTHYRSTVTAVVDATAGTAVDLDVEVMGGDTYLVVEVPAGTEVAVPGYEGEPYIRIHADGVVEVNQRSPARWLNDARYGGSDVEVPASADVDAPPDWERVAEGGTYAWHDHRIHFMSPALPPQVDPSRDAVQEVWDWEVPVSIDGQQARIEGVLAWVPGTGITVPLLGLIVVIALGLVLVRSIGADPLIVVAALLTAALAVSLNLGLPPGADTYPALWLLTALAVGVFVVGRWIGGDGLRGSLLRTLSVVPSAVAASLLVGALDRPIVPGLLPPAATGALVITILALAVASAVPLARRVWAATSLDLSEGGSSEAD